MQRYRYGTAIAEVVPAEGVKGFLLRDAVDGSAFFRVCAADGTHSDCRLRHDDLEITISADAMASFYCIGDDAILDHSPQVLGLKPAP